MGHSPWAGAGGHQPAGGPSPLLLDRQGVFPQGVWTHRPALPRMWPRSSHRGLRACLRGPFGKVFLSDDRYVREKFYVLFSRATVDMRLELGQLSVVGDDANMPRREGGGRLSPSRPGWRPKPGIGRLLLGVKGQIVNIYVSWATYGLYCIFSILVFIFRNLS